MVALTRWFDAWPAADRVLATAALVGLAVLVWAVAVTGAEGAHPRIRLAYLVSAGVVLVCGLVAAARLWVG